MNDYLDYYGKNNISPVNQDVSDLSLHYRRRQKLYRLCGIPTFAFRYAQMLEVGPGGGHNALAPLHWGVEHLDLVEPNEAGRNRINTVFAEHSIKSEQYTIFPTTIEEFETDKLYDIIVAEGFLGYIPNAASVCKKLKNRLSRGGGL